MKRRLSITIRSLQLCVLFNFTAPAIERLSFAYVSLDSAQAIAVYRIGSQNGDLQYVGSMATAGQPGSLAIDPTGRYLHAAIRTKNSVSSYAIDPVTGLLTLIGTINVGWNPVYLRVDRSGKFLLTAYFSDNKAAVYSIGGDGAVKSGALQVISTPANPHSIRTDRSNRFLFIPCRAGEAVLQFRFDETTGAVTANSPDRTGTPDSTGPRHITFHPTMDAAYVANEYGRSVTTYRINTAGGTMAALQTLPMQSVRPGVLVIAPNTGGADVHVTPDARFLYATTRGPDSIAAFRIDASTGTLSPIARYMTEKMPRAFAIDPSGSFLYVGGQQSRSVSEYRIQSATGELTLMHSIPVGSNPVWIQIVQTEPQTTQEVGELKSAPSNNMTLSQNFPNPFNPSTSISFSLRKAAFVTLLLHDSAGREAASLLRETTGVGEHTVHVDGTQLSSGIYFYSLQSGGARQTKMMALVK